MFMDDYKLKISSRYRDEMYNKFLGTNDINQVFEKINTCNYCGGNFETEEDLRNHATSCSGAKYA